MVQMQEVTLYSVKDNDFTFTPLTWWTTDEDEALKLALKANKTMVERKMRVPTVANCEYLSGNGNIVYLKEGKSYLLSCRQMLEKRINCKIADVFSFKKVGETIHYCIGSNWLKDRFAYERNLYVS